MQNLAQFITSLHAADVVATLPNLRGVAVDDNGTCRVRLEVKGKEMTFRKYGDAFYTLGNHIPYNIIDLVVMALLNTSEGDTGELYKEAVRRLVRDYGHLLSSALRAATHDVARSAHMLYFCQFHLLNKCQLDRTGKEALGFGWMTNVPGVSLVKGVTWNMVKRFLFLSGKDKPENESILVLPMYSSPCQLAAFLVRTASSKEGEWETYWTGMENKLAYSGVGFFHEGMKLFAHQTPEEYMQAVMSVKSAAECHTYLIPAEPSNADTWYPPACYVVTDGKPEELLKFSVLASTPSWIEVTSAQHVDYLDALGVMSWNGAVADAVVDCLTAGTPLMDVDMLKPLMRGNRDVVQRVVRKLEGMGHMQTAYNVSQMFKEGLIWSTGEQEVYATPMGYVYEDARNRAIGGAQVTNFTVTPRMSARFEAGDLCYRCSVNLRGDVREMDIPAHVFETPRRMAEYIQTAAALSGNPPEVQPTVFEAAYARPVLGYLHQKFSEMSPVRGISCMGWNLMRTKFNGPDFVSAEHIMREIPVLKPGVGHLDVFTPRMDYAKQKKYKELPESFQRVLEACAGIIARSYANSELTPVLYKDTPVTRSVLKELFASAGQERVVRLNPNFRKGAELQVFQGYPVLATGYNSNQACASQVGMILLGEMGEEIDKQEDVSGAAAALRYVLEELPAWIIRQDGLPCVFSSVDVTSNMIVSDGRGVLEEFFAS